MTTSDTKNAIESAIKPINDIKIESAAVKSGLPTAGIVTKTDEVKIKTPVKIGKKVVVKKAVAAPARAQAPASLKAKLPPQATSKLTAKAPALRLTNDPKSTQARVKLSSKIKVQPTAKPSVKVITEKISKQKKPKLVRDSFTIPKAEYLVLDDLKQRAVKTGSPTKKSELLRAGIKALAAMSDAGFKAALSAVPTIKTGRPAKD